MSFTLDSTLQFPNAAIKVRNEYVLWQPGQQSGNNVRLAGVNGDLARRRFLTTTTHTLELVISGTAVVTGSATTPAANLEANVKWLRDSVCAPVSSASGTRTLLMTMPSGAQMTGQVHVTNFRFGQVAPHAKWALATIDISIPAGELTVVVPPPP
jgi:hypothetical protein